MGDEISNSPSSQTKSAAREAPMLAFIVILARYKREVLLPPLVAAVLTAAISLLLPNWYTGTSKIMPPQQSQSNALALLGQLGALTGGVTSQALGLKNPSDIYVAMLKSRTVADRLIERFDLKKVYDEELFYYARKELAQNSSIFAGREGVITIEVEDKDPSRAAAMANAYTEELQDLTVKLAVSEAAQRRLFFEGQLKRARLDLANAETELQRFTKASGLVSPQGQIGITVAASAALRAQIAAREVQLSAMRSFATENNPDVLRMQQELSALRIELSRMDKDGRSVKGDAVIPFEKASEVGMEYIRRFRDVKYFETLYEVLAKQYEIARIDEAKDATLIQILDTAVAPDKKSKPKRLLLVVLATCLGFVLGVLLALIKDYASRANANADLAAQLSDLKRVFRRG